MAGPLGTEKAGKLAAKETGWGRHGRRGRGRIAGFSSIVKRFDKVGPEPREPKFLDGVEDTHLLEGDLPSLAGIDKGNY